MATVEDIIISVCVAALIFFFIIAIPSAEKDIDQMFDSSFAELKQNNEILFKYTNMSESDKTAYQNNTCDIVFNNSMYRKQDARLCKVKMTE